MRRVRITLNEALEEWHRSRFGPKSAELKEVINWLRWRPGPDRHVLVREGVAREWKIARLPGVRGAPVRVIDDRVFDDRQKAEAEVLKLRWQEFVYAMES